MCCYPVLFSQCQMKTNMFHSIYIDRLQVPTYLLTDFIKMIKFNYLCEVEKDIY